eukprot:1160178-Pelagomonas_calceolata.AAC.16
MSFPPMSHATVSNFRTKQPPHSVPLFCMPHKADPVYVRCNCKRTWAIYCALLVLMQLLACNCAAIAGGLGPVTSCPGKRPTRSCRSANVQLAGSPLPSAI